MTESTVNAATETGTTTWNIDADHTHVGFTARHMMITKVKGQFSRVSGTLELDDQAPEQSRVSVQIDAASIDTGSDKRDDHLRSGDFLDVENYPHLTFESRSVKRLGDGRYELTGDLTIRDQTRPVTLDVEEEGRGTDPWGGERASFSATGKIDRREFGLTWNQALEAGGVLVSDEIKLSFDVQVVRA
jgi:polyisoprenoid-binding protein YceI